MTSAQTMLNRVFSLTIIVALSLVLGACSMTKERDPLSPPGVIVSPYDSTQGDVLWAVIPPLNESGTSIAQSDAIGDAIVAAAQGVRGVRCLPINRSIDAMRSLGFINGIEQGRKGVAQIETPATSMADVEHALQLGEEILFVVEGELAGCDGNEEGQAQCGL